MNYEIGNIKEVKGKNFYESQLFTAFIIMGLYAYAIAYYGPI